MNNAFLINYAASAQVCRGAFQEGEDHVFLISTATWNITEFFAFLVWPPNHILASSPMNIESVNSRGNSKNSHILLLFYSELNLKLTRCVLLFWRNTWKQNIFGTAVILNILVIYCSWHFWNKSTINSDPHGVYHIADLSLLMQEQQLFLML